MDNYYMVYDLTPMNERNLKYIQIGIGKKNPENILAKQQYDTKFDYYWPEA